MAPRRARPRAHPLAFSQREKQVLDALYERSPATVGDILERMPNPPGYSAVRAMLARLEEKGFVRHETDGPKYRYRPVLGRERTGASLLKRIVDAYFDGSPTKLVAAVLDRSSIKMSKAELDELARLVKAARRSGGS